MTVMAYCFGKKYRNPFVFASSFAFLLGIVDGYDDQKDVVSFIQIGVKKMGFRNDPTPVEKLDGGGEPWPLFQAGQVPRYQPDDTLKEAFVPEDENDPVVARCAPGSHVGYLYYNVSDPHIVPFIVKQGQPNRVDAAVIVAPGGGCDLLAWNKEGTHAAKWLNSIGFSAFVLKYRVPCGAMPNRILDLIDAQRAVSLVRHNIGKFGINASRIGFMGFSAGGLTAARVSYTQPRVYARKDEVDFENHLPNFALIIYGRGEPSQAYNAPPTFISIAVNDQCVSAKLAEGYYLALQANGLHHELHIYSDGRHGYGDCSMYVEGGVWRSTCLWTANAKLFLESQVLGIHKPLVEKPMYAFYMGLSSNSSL